MTSIRGTWLLIINSFSINQALGNEMARQSLLEKHRVLFGEAGGGGGAAAMSTPIDCCLWLWAMNNSPGHRRSHTRTRTRTR